MRSTSAGVPLVLVEGESDRRALDVLAGRLGHAEPNVVVLRGITNLRAALHTHAPRQAARRVLLLHDVAETAYVARVLAETDRPFLRFVCDADLEDELVRAVGTEGMLRLIEARGERASFDLLVRQPAQRARSTEQHLRRFLSARSGHKLVYAGLLADAVALDHVPAPLRDLLSAVVSEPQS